MRVLHVIEGVDIRLGGLSTLLADITSIERHIGLDNEILSLECPAQFVNPNIEGPMHLFPASFPHRLSNSGSAISWLKDHAERFDAIVIHSTWNLLAQRAGIVAARMGIPYIFWPHNSLDPFDLQKKKEMKALLGPTLIRNFLSKARAICSASELESNRLQLFGVNLPRYVLPYPVRFDGAKGSRKSFRDRYSLSEEEFVFLFLSRVDYKKGLDLAVRAFAAIAGQFPLARFIVAGPDTKGYAGKIRRLIDDLALGDKVKMIGTVTGQPKSDAFSGSDCFVLTSLNESFGIAVVEALQSDLPVLISDNVYIYQDVERLDGGWICQSEVASIEKSMRLILTEKEEYAFKASEAQKAGRYFSDLERLKRLYSDFYYSIFSSTKSQENEL